MTKRIIRIIALGISLGLVACGGSGSSGGGGYTSGGASSTSSASSSSSSIASSSTSASPDWTMFQGDASHTGYVDLNLDSSLFKKAWEWIMPPKAGADLNPVVTSQGVVYADTTLGGLYAIDAATGATNWSYDLKTNIASNGSVDSVAPPALDNGMLYVPAYVTFSTSPGAALRSGAVLAARISDGTVTRFYRFDSQGGISQAPAIRDGVVYYVAGEYGGQVYAFPEQAATDGNGEAQPLWASAINGTNGFNSEGVAVDAEGVYYYTGQGLSGYDLTTGATSFTISNPADQSDWTLAMGNNTPLLGTMSDAVSFVRAPYENSQNYGRLGSFNIVTHTLNWVSQAQYGTSAAIANGIIYSAERGPDVEQLDALSESDGHVLWSWTPPASDTLFLNNVVITQNLAFVSTDKAVYAIDLTTHKSVWSYPAAGALALSSAGILFINVQALNSSTAFEATGHLVAIKLK